MALAPQFAGHTLGSANAAHTIEAYLDFVCPFSAKFFTKFYDEVLPYLEKEHHGKVKFVFRQQVQPWHPNSTLVHEAAIAVERIDPSKFIPFARALFQRQREYFDEATYFQSRHEIYGRLADLAASVGVSGETFLGLVSVPTGEPRNIGNKITADLKLQIRLGRQNGIHVSPTVLWDGIRDDSVSSSWEIYQWKEWLRNKITA
ncbi:uncharacterized protein VTP21DRAFT_202 [Calcarisporiella thermophila]|uniref:uncharacterized protein n=1 Tax=Calcarisporiella thermophila TaxID=911321 RepID=UPI0037427E12